MWEDCGTERPRPQNEHNPPLRAIEHAKKKCWILQGNFYHPTLNHISLQIWPVAVLWTSSIQGDQGDPKNYKWYQGEHYGKKRKLYRYSQEQEISKNFHPPPQSPCRSRSRCWRWFEGPSNKSYGPTRKGGH